MLDRLQVQFPELIFMAIGRREDEGTVASLLSTGRIYRYLHKPISPGRAFQFLNAATRRYNELRDGTARRLADGAHDRSQAAVSRQSHCGRRRRARGGRGIRASGGHSRDQGLPATLQTTHVAESSVEDQVKSKLGSAQIAYLSGRLIDPRGDNALQYYRDVLTLDAKNADAKAGVQKVIDTLEQRVVKALEERNARSRRDGLDSVATSGSESSAARYFASRSCWRCLATAPKRSASRCEQCSAARRHESLSSARAVDPASSAAHAAARTRDVCRSDC